MINIRAIILDVDGTLLNDNKKIGEKTISILKQVKNDIKIILASARQFYTIKPYLEELDLLDNDNYTISFNGALIVDNKENQLFSSRISPKVLIEIDFYFK